VSHKQLEQAHEILRHQFEERFHIVGESIPIKALRKQIALIAPNNIRVLIYGESGTGKELVARNLHFLSKRTTAAFVEVNCAAIPEELIESELFGHTKGSFTGASETKKGKFELADGGTLFLDEIGDMSMKTQAKVLRAVEEKSFQPIGAPTGVRVDVRVLAATNKNLPEEISAGRFREDLFYRLNVIPFLVPPLRERREDIPVLSRYFMRMFAVEHGSSPKEFDSNALDLMTDYSWPGNVRELRNEVERLVIMVQDDVIREKDLSLPDGNSSATASTLHEARAQYEKEFILSKLKENNWNVSQAARALGLERSYLYRKMKTYGIEK
jgi:two-component system nitrogen regulation response regulator NtrX